MADDAFDLERILARENYRRYVDRAKHDLSILFREKADSVFYERQLQVHFEDIYFHWITSKALKELVDERLLNTELVDFAARSRTSETSVDRETAARASVRFYWSHRKRYWRREAAEILSLIESYSNPALTSAYGRQAEMMFDAALPKAGFLPVDENTAEYRGTRWTKSNHNLDRIYERDGVGYGAEIKNSLGYIEPDELSVKLKMCEFLGLKPIFITRMMPRLYNIAIIRDYGGYSLIFKYQLYPFHMGDFVRRLREKLGLPVDCPHAIERGTVERLSQWHLRELGK